MRQDRAGQGRTRLGGAGERVLGAGGDTSEHQECVTLPQPDTPPQIKPGSGTVVHLKISTRILNIIHQVSCIIYQLTYSVNNCYTFCYFLKFLSNTYNIICIYLKRRLHQNHSSSMLSPTFPLCIFPFMPYLRHHLDTTNHANQSKN